MNNHEDMTGAFSAFYTPFDRQDGINVDMIEKMVEFQLAEGIKGFYVTGGTGEFLLLDEAERKLMLESVLRFNRGRVKVVAHVGHASTKTTVRLARHAEKCGADWISSVAPIYFGTSFEGAVRHYTEIARATALPFMIYAFDQQIVPERDARLFDIPNIMGMKYTGKDYYAIQCMTRRIEKPIRLFAGCDEQLVAALAMGIFHGGIGTTYNVIPRHFAEICRLMQEGKVSEATRIQDEANRVIELMISSENRSFGKAMMKYIGFDCGWCRSPFAPLSEIEYHDFVHQIERLGILHPFRRDAA